jgi:hypothetical protein
MPHGFSHERKNSGSQYSSAFGGGPTKKGGLKELTIQQMRKIEQLMEENARLREENAKLRAGDGDGGKIAELLTVMSGMQSSMKMMEERLARADMREDQFSEIAEVLANAPAPKRALTQRDNMTAVDPVEAETAFQRRKPPPTYCVFIDGPDPDNFICVLSAFQLLAKPTGTKLHIILTGRPVNLHVNMLTDEQRNEKLAAGVKFTDLLRAKPEDASYDLHSQAVLNDMLARLESFLCSVGIDRSRFVLYDGGIAPTAYVSHQMHAREFLFDRADLAQELLGGKEEDYVTGSKYKVMSAETYHKILSKLDSMGTNEKVRVFRFSHLSCYHRSSLLILVSSLYACIRSPDHICHHFLQAEFLLNKILRKPEKPFPPIDAFVSNVANDRNLCVVVGGPFTGLHQALLLGGPALKSKITTCHAMMAAWDIGKPNCVNLFKNQFNVGADLHAAEQMLVHPKGQHDMTQPPSGFPMYLIPTETCKCPSLALTPDKLRKYIPENLPWGQDVLNLYSLWYDVSGKRPFFIFDFAPVISACVQGEASDIFKYSRCNATLDEEEQLLLQEDPNGTLLCAERDMGELQTKRYFEMLSRIFDDAALLHEYAVSLEAKDNECEGKQRL